MKINVWNTILQLSKERGVESSVIIAAIEESLRVAGSKYYTHGESVQIMFRPEKGELRVYTERKIVENSADPAREVGLEEARMENPAAELGETLEVDLPSDTLGRIAAQAAKQVIVQKVRDAEQEKIYGEYAPRVGEIVAGVFRRAEAGVDIFRVFDALNDMRNWEVAVKALMDAKKEGLMAHFQAAVCYSLTQRRMGGPIFNLDYYVDFAKKSEDMGADSVVLKDMAGMCSPNDAYAIIKGMKETIKIPVEFHTHYTSGSGSMSYLKAIEAGVDVLDTCLSPFALRTSQPAIEPLLVAWRRWW